MTYSLQEWGKIHKTKRLRKSQTNLAFPHSTPQCAAASLQDPRSHHWEFCNASISSQSRLPGIGARCNAMGEARWRERERWWFHSNSLNIHRNYQNPTVIWRRMSALVRPSWMCYRWEKVQTKVMNLTKFFANRLLDPLQIMLILFVSLYHGCKCRTLSLRCRVQS